MDGPPKGLIAFTVVVVLIVCVVGGAFVTLRQRVDPGNVGVLIDYNRQGTGNQPYHENVPTGSYRWVMPGQRLVEYPISQQTLVMAGDNTISCRDRNGIQVGTDVTILWRVDPAHAANLYFLRPGLDLKALEEAVVRRDSRSVVDQSCSAFTYEELYGAKKPDISKIITDRLSPILANSFIVVDRVALGETHLGAPQQQALEAKALADQEAQRAAFLKVKAENEAQGKIAEAEGNRRVAEIQAQQKAQATIAQAEADKKALELLVQALGGANNYLAWLQVNKWDGTLPTTTVGEGTPFVIAPR